MLWCIAILVRYYPKLGHLVTAGPSAWVKIDPTDGQLNGLHSFPALHEAATRAGRGVVGATLVLLVAHASGTGLSTVIKWRSADWRERLVFHVGAGFLVLSEASIGLAVVHLYRRPVVAGLVVAVALVDVGIVIRTWRARRGERTTNASERLLAIRRDIAWKVLVGSALVIALIGALAPEREFDALWFHLDFPRQWLQTGHLIQPPSEYVSLYPMSFETIYGAGLAVGGQVAAKLVHFACLPLTGLIVYQATRRYFPRAKPWLAVALLVTTPTVLWEATTTYIDLSGAFFVALAGYALLRYLDTRSRSWLLMAGLDIGMAIASKHLALLTLALFVLLLTIGLRRAGVSPARTLRSAGVLVGLGLVAAVPWYLHSFLASGNPVFPEAYGVFGAPADRWNSAADQGLHAFMSRFGVTRTFLDLLTLPWSVTVHGARFGGTFGPLFVMLLPVLAVRRGQPSGWFVTFAVGYGLLWASPISSFQLRWLLPAVPVMAVIGAEAASRLYASIRASRHFAAAGSAALTIALAIIMILNLPPLTPYQEGDRRGFDGWLTHVMRQPPLAVVLGVESQRSYLARAVPSSLAWRYLDHHTPPDAVIMTLTDEGDRFLTHRTRLPYDAAIAQPTVARAGQERQALTALRRLGVTYVLFDRRLLSPNDPGRYAIATSRALTCWYHREYDDSRFIVGRLLWPKLLPAIGDGGSRALGCDRVSR